MDTDRYVSFHQSVLKVARKLWRHDKSPQVLTLIFHLQSVEIAAASLGILVAPNFGGSWAERAEPVRS